MCHTKVIADPEGLKSKCGYYRTESPTLQVRCRMLQEIREEPGWEE